uniref:G protein-coupled receptor 137c n=1 Tax=Hucho hucho TaxID=62062 RepID=A0A4W5RWZ8_9TELE
CFAEMSCLAETGGLVLSLSAVPPSVELGLTIVYTVLYSLLFLFVYLQLWLILHYGHKRFSYQSVFLFLCLLWSALRTTLFSFYFKNVVQANQLQPLPYWLLYCFPVCLQFFTLCLLNLYFAQVMFKAKAKYSPELPMRLAFIFASLFFLVVNLTCAMLVRQVVLARVLVNDSLFVLCAISLAVLQSSCSTRPGPAIIWWWWLSLQRTGPAPLTTAGTTSLTR